MCGIAGIVNINSDVKPQEIDQMMNLLVHRGPDFKNTYLFNNVALAHTRLKIQDLSDSANQPFISECGNYILIFNGEIYNHQQLKKSIQFKNFKSHSDTETLFHGLIELGAEFVKKLNGIFAFAFYNKPNNSILLARDRFGVKPLYYSLLNNKFIFSSEIKAIKSTHIDFTVNHEAEKDYQTYLSCASSKTLYNEVNKLVQGNILALNIQNLNFKIETYFQIPTRRTYITDSEFKIKQTTKYLLIESLNRQLVSDAPIGFFLSGGLDSSLLVALAQKYSKNHNIKAFTIDQNTTHLGFENDLPYAKLLAKQLQFDLEIVDSLTNTESNVNDLIQTIEEPIYDMSALNVKAISEQAKKQDIKVLISGLGADEVFSGYRRHQFLQYHQYLKYLPVSFLNFIVSNLLKNTTIERRLNKITNAAYSDINLLLIALLQVKQKKLHINNLSEKEKELYSFLKSFDNDTSLIDKALALEQISYLPNQNLLYTDKVAMTHGIEVRVPYLDNELVDYVYNIPPKFKLKGLNTKYILREIAKEYLPKEILSRSKTGFSGYL